MKRLTSLKIKWLLVPLMLLFFSIPQIWGAGAISVSTAMKIYPAGSTTVSNTNWQTSGAPTTYGSAQDYTINSNGSFTFSNAADYGTADYMLQLAKNGGYIETTISSTAGVDVVIGLKKGSKGTLTVSLTDADNQTYSSTSWGTITISTTNTSATLKILKEGDKPAGVSFIAIFPKQAGGSGDYTLVESAGDIGPGKYLLVYDNTYALTTHNGAVNVNTYGTRTDISSYYSSKKITANATTNALAYEVVTSPHGYCIKKSSENSFLGFTSTAQNPTGATLRWETAFTESADEWTLGVNSIVSYRSSSYAIRYNASSNYFAIYTTSGQSAVQLFKKTDAVSTKTLVFLISPFMSP